MSTLVWMILFIGFMAMFIIGLANEKRWYIILLMVLPFLLGMMWLPVKKAKICNEYIERREPLYAGYNENKIEGESFLFSSTIDEVDYVEYWVDNGGVKKKYQVEMRKSSFVEDGQNVLLMYDNNKCPDKWGWFFWTYQEYEYEFHVPEGSIQKMYSFK